MSKKVAVNCGALLTIRRPNGEIEKVEFTRFTTLVPASFASIKKATKDAGRGDVLSWEQMTKMVDDYTPTAGELASARHDNERRAIERMSATGRA